METRSIGSLQVSVIGLGTNNFGFYMDEAGVAPVVDAALECGINLLDTADSYLASERRLGAALGSRRDQVVLATKFGSSNDELAGGAAPDYVRSAVDRSLSELGTDRIDLYQLHKPDPSTPIADTLGALSELQGAGKIIEIGCSNFSALQLREAATAGSTAQFASVQNHYSLLRRDDEAEVIPPANSSVSPTSRTSRSRAVCSPASTAAVRRRQRERGSPSRARAARLRSTTTHASTSSTD